MNFDNWISYVWLFFSLLNSLLGFIDGDFIECIAWLSCSMAVTIVIGYENEESKKIDWDKRYRKNKLNNLKMLK